MKKRIYKRNLNRGCDWVMKVEDYEVLVTLHKAGTVKGAAERLMISQPAISQRLKQIEQTWGVEMFIRTPRQLMITPAGEKVVAHGEELLLKEAQLKNELAALEKEVGGSLSLGVSSVVGLYVLPNLLEKYIKKIPESSIAANDRIKSRNTKKH
ncbi:MAG: LysR family transcriptional regulator [Bacillus sp. (in: Bacteria)]|nr:LysR family transcriptional regulator [Bacillus sp. (in: firmicutes)]